MAELPLASRVELPLEEHGGGLESDAGTLEGSPRRNRNIPSCRGGAILEGASIGFIAGRFSGMENHPRPLTPFRRNRGRRRWAIRGGGQRGRRQK
eukprot:5728369-Pyramimonas_sp.AAC.2